MFMSSSRNKFTLLYAFCWFPSAMLVPVQLGTSMASPLGKTFLQIFRIWKIPLSWILARVFAYLAPFISLIPDVIYWTVWFLFWSILNDVTLKTSNEWFSSNRIPMFCAQDSGIARGQTWRVATKKCMAWSCLSVKSSVFGHRVPHFAVILWETEVTNVGALKFQVSVCNVINSIDKHSLREVECGIYVHWIYTDMKNSKERSRNI